MATFELNGEQEIAEYNATLDRLEAEDEQRTIWHAQWLRAAWEAYWGSAPYSWIG